MHSYIFGKPNSSIKTKSIEAPSLEDAILEFRTTELYPELYASKDFVTGHKERPYNPILTVSADAVIEVCEVIKGERNVLTLLTVSDVLNAPLTNEKQHLLPGTTAHDEEALTAAENSHSLPFTKQNARKEMDSLIEQKLSLEKQMEALNEQIRAMQEKLQNAAKTLRLMKNYAGIDAELVRIRDGEAASEDTQLSVYQQKLFMDENVGIIDLLSGGTDSLDVHNLEEFDKWIAEHYKTFMPAEKALTVWQIRRNAKEYIRGNSFETSFFNRILNGNNFQTYFLIRNGEKLWRFTSDFHVPDAVFPKRRRNMTGSQHPERSKTQRKDSSPWPHSRGLLTTPTSSVQDSGKKKSTCSLLMSMRNMWYSSAMQSLTNTSLTADPAGGSIWRKTRKESEKDPE